MATIAHHPEILNVQGYAGDTLMFYLRTSSDMTAHSVEACAQIKKSRRTDEVLEVFNIAADTSEDGTNRFKVWLTAEQTANLVSTQSLQTIRSEAVFAGVAAERDHMSALHAGQRKVQPLGLGPSSRGAANLYNGEAACDDDWMPAFAGVWDLEVHNPTQDGIQVRTLFTGAIVIVLDVSRGGVC